MRIIGRLAVWVALLGMPGVAWVLAHIAWALWDGRGVAVQVDDLVAMGAAGCGAAVAGYLAVTGWAMMLGALVRGGRSIPRTVSALVPASWQRVTATALGLTMSAGFGAPALATQSEAPPVGWSEPVASQQLDPPHAHTTLVSPAGWAAPSPLTVPSAAASDGGAITVGFAPAPAPAPTPAESDPSPTPQETAQDGTAGPPSASEVTDSAQTYTVVHGDSLWRISARLLGPEASDASINRAWPELYAANADAVGSDPALIHPGLVLTVPAGLGS
jgi:LysM repeat protein